MLLEMAAEGDPERVVLGSHDGGVTAAGLLERARRAALYFEKSGAEVVGYFGVNSDVLPVALFGSALAGVPFTPINYRAPDEQLKGILGRVTGGLMIADDDEVDRLRVCGADNVVTKGEFASAIAEPVTGEHPFVDPEEIAVLLFTSGTTSEPKAAVLRHRHLVSYIISSVEFLGCAPGEAQLICVPPYHIAGIAAVLSSLYAGRRIMYLPAFDANVVGAPCRRGAHHSRHGRADDARADPLRGRGRRRRAAGAATPVLRRRSDAARAGRAHPALHAPRRPRQRLRADRDQLDDRHAHPDDHREAFASDDPVVRARLGSVGRPLPSLEVEVRGADDEVLPAGQKGEIWVRGEQVAGEYVGNNVLTEDGWFRTCDAGWFDTEGFLYVEGRLDDVIVRGAENISPGEVEEVLMAHGAVAEAAVIGIPDVEWGEAVAAVVVLHPGAVATEAELQDWVRVRLRSTKMPCVVEFRDELPYSPTGKLLRRVLRDELAEAVGGPSSS